MRNKLVYLFPVVLLIYSVVSFSQVDPNLVLSSRPWFWNFQQLLWQLGYHNRFLFSIIYLVLVGSLFFLYRLIVQKIQTHALSVKKAIVLFGLSIMALLPSYPALSHDIFNYIFNAKMVVVYHVNPHINVATDFPNDPWIKFMNNIQTPAPYGYGWTGFSLVPYIFGNNYLQAELLTFRLTMIGFFILTLWLIYTFGTVSWSSLALLAFNPLVLIEVVGNIHNDIVMMAGALGSILLLKRMQKTHSFWLLLPASGLFAFSVSIKYATLALVGAYLCFFATRFWKRCHFTLAQWAVIWMWIPLLTNQSQRFLPWYLLWSLTFIPFIQQKRWQSVLICSSLAGLLGYVPYLWTGEYTITLLLIRSLILFGIPIGYTGYAMVKDVIIKRSQG